MLDIELEEGEDPWDYAAEDSLGELVEPRDNFAVPADEGNAEGVEFYLLQCQSRKSQVMEGFTCTWGNTFDIGQHK